MQLQYIRSKQRLYTMDDLGQVIKDYECRSAIVPGYNGAGQERESLPNGNYTVSADYPGMDLAAEQGAAYGTFYIPDILRASTETKANGCHLQQKYLSNEGRP